MTSDNRNTIIFVVCAAVGLLAYQALVLDPAARKRTAQIQQQKAAAAQLQRDNLKALSGIQPVGPDGRPAPLTLPRAQAKAASPRIAVETPALSGSVSLKGGRLDDLFLKKYRVTVDPKSPPVELLRPEGAQNAWFADFGWAGATPAGLPAPTTIWTQTAGSVLAPHTPVTLTWDNGAGLRFTRQISVDDSFMFTVVDSVANLGTAPVALAPYASIQRQGLPTDLGKSGVIHEGAVGALGEEKEPTRYEDRLLKYKAWKKDGGKSYASDGGWLGITDKYWLAALIPDGKNRITGQYRVTNISGVDIYDANFVGQLKTVTPGATISQTTRLFAGAKSVPVLRQYEKTFSIPRFDSAIDWGMFWFFTRPIFLLLDFFYRHVGNFGVAILLLTVTVKLLFFPLANKSYESITKMKKVQPQIEALRAQYKDDPAAQQKELMGLYAKEKINPLTGCLPMLIQIPVFYALYKVLNVTIEMRHAPFIGFINDLSARDPSSLWNLFGILPYDPAMIPLLGSILNGPLHVGLLGIAYGGTMWLTTSMNPPAADPMQQKIFQWMPVIFTFTLAQVAVGLMIYWAWNNVLSIIQQYIIMRRFKVDNPIDDIIGKLTGKAKPKAAG
jgi:YidC/Oxa1 family membrane protein insertase